MAADRTFGPGEILMAQGDIGDSALLIQAGRVEVVVAKEDGTELVLGEMGAGDLVGEMALISGEPRSATVRALEETKVKVVNFSVLQELLAQSDPVVALLTRVLLDRYHEARSRLLSLPPSVLPEPVRNATRGGGGLEALPAMEEFEMMTELRQALEGNQFKLFYQPIIDLSTGRLAGFEALIRWIHPERGMVSPARFIPVAEKSKAIIPIGYWILETAARDLNAIRERAESVTDHNPFMSINLAPVQISDPELEPRALAILEESGAPLTAIKLELTESGLVADTGRAHDLLSHLRNRSLRLAIDDFGTGYSSLSYLHSFPLDTLKIDNTFIGTMFADERSRAIVEAIVALCKSLGLDIIAEGVETRDIEAVIMELGCEYGQGYLYSRPVPIEEALELVNASFRAGSD